MLADLATEEGASSWLTAIPLDWYVFTLHKGAYRDVLCLRYGWQPPQLASHCVCGQAFTISHAFPTRGYPFNVVCKQQVSYLVTSTSI